MPNRILKESICTSENIALLCAEEEVFFYRLLVNCDDYGRMDGRASILLSRCFPLMYGKKTECDIDGFLAALVRCDLIILYEVDGRPYIQVTKWDKHQTVRNKRSKFPAVSDGTCLQVQADVSVIQSNPNPNPNPNPELSAAASAAAADSRSAIKLILNDKSYYAVSHEMVKEWTALYPAVDVMQELRNIHGWLLANYRRRKTAAGILPFINSWLKKEQDKGRSGASGAPVLKPTAFSNFKQPVIDYTAIERRALYKLEDEKMPLTGGGK